jgi:hypothetical protein
LETLNLIGLSLATLFLKFIACKLVLFYLGLALANPTLLYCVTISGGFTGEGESSSSRKKYIRQVMLCQEDNKQAAEREPDVFFSPRDFQDVVPHDDDPMVIAVQIFKWDTKRVLINTGSSTDILYYETFERMGIDYNLSGEHWRDSLESRFMCKDTSL